MLIDSKAQLIASRLVSSNAVPQAVAFDPATLLILAQILMALVGMFRQCNKSPEQALKAAQQPSWIQGIRMASLVIRKLRGKKGGSIDPHAVTVQLLDLANGMTVEEMQTAYREFPR